MKNCLPLLGVLHHVQNRVTVYGQYDINVNNHWDEDID